MLISSLYMARNFGHERGGVYVTPLSAISVYLYNSFIYFQHSQMPSDYLRQYERMSKSLKKHRYFEHIETARHLNSTNASLNGTLVFSRRCVSILKDIDCAPVYCSADEERILIKYSWETCKIAVDSW